MHLRTQPSVRTTLVYKRKISGRQPAANIDAYIATDAQLWEEVHYSGIGSLLWISQS